MLGFMSHLILLVLSASKQLWGKAERWFFFCRTFAGTNATIASQSHRHLYVICLSFVKHKDKVVASRTCLKFKRVPFPFQLLISAPNGSVESCSRFISASVGLEGSQHLWGFLSSGSGTDRKKGERLCILRVRNSRSCRRDEVEMFAPIQNTDSFTLILSADTLVKGAEYESCLTERMDLCCRCLWTIRCRST